MASDGSRQLPTMVRYPATRAGAGTAAERAGGPYPLVVFSEGFDISSEAYDSALDRWASAGYVVADPIYPFTDAGNPGALNEADIVRHPHDLSSVITALLQAGATPDGPLSNLIDKAHIGLAGHSDGGDVTDAVAANTCCHDSRVTAAVILSGAELVSFGGSYTAAPGLPLLVTQGSADTINPPACGEQIYDGASAPKYYLDLIGAGHHAPYLSGGPYRTTAAQANAYQNVVTRVTLDFWNGYLKESSAARSAITRDGAVPGLSTLAAGTELAPQGACPGAPAGR